MKLEVSHSWEEETMEAKIKWFLQKTPEQRLLEAFKDTSFMQKWIQFELPDDRSSFKTYQILERSKS